MNDQSWQPLEPTLDEILAQCDNPMEALAQGEVPAIVLRNAFPSDHCRGLVERFYERDLVPGLPLPGEEIPEKPAFERKDVGTSLGNLGRTPDEFFKDAEKTLELYEHLFDGFVNPIELMYSVMDQLAPGKKAMTAREPDGRLYGPAIFRCHMPHWGYPPHIDSVRLREKRTGYEVHRFEHQLAGIILLQSPEKGDGYCDTILHKCPWNDEVSQILRTNIQGKVNGNDVLDKTGFDRFAEEEGFPNYRTVLSEGDMYFFNSESLHEVPRFSGHTPRIVMATFFGYSTDDPEIYIWS